MVSDRERFPCLLNSEWQAGRPETFFWEMLDGAFQKDGLKGLRWEVVNYFKRMGGDLGINLEFVNALTHLAEGVLNARTAHWMKKGYDEPSAAKKAEEWPLYRSILRLWDESHKMTRLWKDRRAWHIRLQKLEKWVDGDHA